MLRISLAVDHRTHEIAEIGNVSLRDGVDLIGHLRPQSLPHRLRDVSARGGRAFLALVLESTANERGAQGVGVGGLVRDHEVLATRFADEARVRAVAVHVLADGSPHALEHLGGSSEVDAGEVLVIEDLLGDFLRAAADHVDDARREAGLVEHLHQEVVYKQGLRCRLEDDGIAHQRGRGGQVGSDRREVERAHGEDEAFQRPVFEAVPGGAVVERLLSKQLVGEVSVITPEVDGLAGSVDLCLVHRLRLAQHRGGVDGVAPRAGEQRGRPQKHSGTLVERGGGPCAARFERCGHRIVEVFAASDCVFGDGQLVTVWRSDVGPR